MNHPFLDPSLLPNWENLTPDRVEPDITKALEDAQKNIDAIAALPADERTYENTFGALEAATEPLYKAWGKVNHLDSVANSAELRTAMNAMLPHVAAFDASVPLNEELYAVLSTAAERPEVRSLTGAKKRFVEETLAEFRQEGAELAPEKKERLKAVKQELAEKTQKFSENVLDATNAYEKIVEDEALLAGLPESARGAARQSAKSKGLGSDEKPVWRFTLHIPSLLPVLKYADSEELRRELYEAFSAIGSEGEQDNTELIWDILALRREQAELLGKGQFADVVLERRMAKNGTSALRFVEDLHDRVVEAFEGEVTGLERFAAAALSAGSDSSADQVAHLEPWQSSYWTEKQRKELFDFDEEELRPYFSIDNVIAGLFELTGRVFGIEVVEKRGADKPSVWHPDVRFYELRDRASGKHLGSFYADWHPRESKRAGAWFNYLSTGARDGANDEPHLGLICGNLTAPVGDEPALLTHREVETIFHEFGHLLHHLLGDVEVKSLNGVNVAWDFVELPSQIMENWTWQRESLDLFARHHESGERIPAELFDRMIRARNYMSASLMMRQLSFGKLDLELHVNYDAYSGRDLDEVLDGLLESYRAPTPTRHPTNVRSFNHLFSDPVGYAAGYYSYKWAEVLEADAFTRFLNEGILSETVGREFRERILSKGNSQDPAELFRSFMGRDPDPEALLVRDGLA
ncbi:MAG: M3 family metallopeptidase [Spirochaetota bacterium]